MGELKDKVAILTGAARGIGLGIAKVLAREGAIVIVNDLKLEGAQKAVEEITAAGGRAMPFEANVTNKASLDAMVAATVKQYGRLDILVNNAGIEAAPRLLQDLPDSQWERVVAVNLKGVMLCCQAVAPTMIKQKHGRIINIGSTAAIRMGFFGSVDYTAAKHGVAGLTQHLSWELADSNITVNAVCPGAVMTPLMEEGTTPEFRENVTKRLIPLGRYCTPEEVGEATSFLASDRAQMITGQMLAVDGGALAGFGEDLRAVVRDRMAAMHE
jgi:NAD(P)-dependent dehydrogenase (short-subunit alcohol dehydrogenase family)